MCLYNQLMENPKYRANKKNGGVIPPISDMRTRWVPISCGECMECRKKKGREWLMRLSEEIKQDNKCKFITLTFSPEKLKELTSKVHILDKENGLEKEREGYDLDNAVCSLAVRRFTERWRKEHKKTVRHWLITELGHKNTEHVHMHGIIWNQDVDKIERIWQYGFVWKGKKRTGVHGRIRYENYVNETTVGYMMKYVTKRDLKHKHYKSQIFASKGIGKSYINSEAAKLNEFKDGETKEYYRTSTGHKVALPIYLRNKIYTEKEREKLWINKLNEEVRYVCGEKISVKDGDSKYIQIRNYYRNKNAQLGYGNGRETNDKAYEIARRKIAQETKMRIASGGCSARG